MGTPRRRVLYRSSAPEDGSAATQGDVPGKTDRYLAALNDYRHLPLAARKGKHFLQLLRIFFHVYINSAIPAPMARNIHNVKKRSRNDSFLMIPSDIKAPFYCCSLADRAARIDALTRSMSSRLRSSPKTFSTPISVTMK